MHTIPTNYTKAINSEDSKYWVSAIQKEFDSFVENNTFEWQKAQKDKNTVESRWVYTQKYKQDGSYEYKTQFAAKGYSQINDKDYRETFAPMTNMASIRLLLQVAVQYDLLIPHMDVKNAYLNAPFDHELYVDAPKRFEGKNGNYVWKLRKSLYGLKQSSQT